MSLLSSSYGESNTEPVKQVALPLLPGLLSSTGQFLGSVNSKVAPPNPNSWSRPSIVTVVTPSGVATPSSARVNGCSDAWSGVKRRNPYSVPSGPRIRHPSA